MNTLYTLGLFISVTSLTISCACDCEESKDSSAVNNGTLVDDTEKEFEYDGIWEGEGQSVKNDNRWGIILQINGRKVNIEYPSLGCQGVLEVLDEYETSIFFQEFLTTKGNCIDQGFVKVRYVSDTTLSYQWWFPNGDLGGHSLLTKME